MIIKTKLSEKEFINASLAIIWSRKYFMIFPVMLLVVLIINIFTSSSIKDAFIPTILPPVLIFAAAFLVFRFSIKRAFKKNHRANENIEYNFTGTHLLMTGESFTSEMTWNKIYKVTKTKNWLLIWHNNQIANAIPLRLVSAIELAQLREILQQNNTKNNL